MPRAGNFRENFGPFVRGSTFRLTEGTTLISSLPISYACRDAISFSLSLGCVGLLPLPSPVTIPFVCQREGTRERSRSLEMAPVRNPPRTGSFGSWLRSLKCARLACERRNHGHNFKARVQLYPHLARIIEILSRVARASARARHARTDLGRN